MNQKAFGVAKTFGTAAQLYMRQGFPSRATFSRYNHPMQAHQPHNHASNARPSLMNRLMRVFFRLLYHSMAWTYDLVAAAVSLGRWKRWVLAAEAMLPPGRILELGFGPGHLQARLRSGGRDVYGLDESAQMALQAARRLRAGNTVRPNLARGLAQALPYSQAVFDGVVATFPTLYIIDPSTLSEIMRVLRPGGRLVVLSAAWHTGRSLPERFMSGLFRITGQVPQADPVHAEAFAVPFEQAGFLARVHWAEIPGSRLLFIVSERPDPL